MTQLSHNFTNNTKENTNKKQTNIMPKISPITTNNLSNVTVVGGGSSAHSLIPLLSASGHKVNLLTRRPKGTNENLCLSKYLLISAYD